MSFNTVKVFLTGYPSVGKTTLIKNIIDRYRQDDQVDVKGFYTEECRKGGNRIGFDIVHWPNGQCSDEEREVLSRQATSFKKLDPRVGNYKVDIENVEKYCVSSMVSNNASNVNSELMIVDEVGKMEMLCPAFLPQVDVLLDEIVLARNRFILGTIPTPRYGRVIQAVEDIRARKDVIVLHVTKANRDEMKDILAKVIQDVFKGNCEFNAVKETFEPYLYLRPIGASSMNADSKRKEERSKKKSESLNEKTSKSQPCGPLVGSCAKVLLVGDTASPLPTNHTYSYCERSMWIVLGRMIGMDYKPIKNVDSATNEELTYFVDLKSKVVEKGICVWDICSDVHEIGVKQSRKRKNAKKSSVNDIESFLEKNPTIDQICFIGKKAKTSFSNHFPIEDCMKWKLTILPSSSTANSRITVDEKAKQWKQAFDMSGVKIDNY